MVQYMEGNKSMIEKHSHRQMRTVGSDRDRAIISNCGWKGGTSSRKALLIIRGETGGRMLTLDDLREAMNSGLSATAMAGNGPSLIDIADVIRGYDTDKELPVLFVDEEGGEEILSMFLYDMPVAA